MFVAMWKTDLAAAYKRQEGMDMRNLQKETETAILDWIRSQGGNHQNGRKSFEFNAYCIQGAI